MHAQEAPCIVSIKETQEERRRATAAVTDGRTDLEVVHLHHLDRLPLGDLEDVVHHDQPHDGLCFFGFGGVEGRGSGRRW